MFEKTENLLVYRYDSEKVWIEAWGEHALRVRATKCQSMPIEDWALQEPTKSHAKITIDESGASITNGKIQAKITASGKICVNNSKGNLLLEEYSRSRRDLLDPKCSALEVEAREFKAIFGGDYHLTLRLESLDKNERIYGMGQYQQPCLDLKGVDLELAHRNSQASVPFAVSSLGYGFLWNNPSIGRAVLGKNVMSFEAYATKILDYWIVAGDTPADIVHAYAAATGTAPMMPEYGLGFWQCKLRYQTQEELLHIAHEHKKRGLPLDVIVVDFFHWYVKRSRYCPSSDLIESLTWLRPKQGDWRFDPTYWPDPGKQD